MSKIPSNWRAVRYEQRLDSSGFSWMVVGDADDEAGEPKTIVLGDWLIEDVARLIASAPALVEALERAQALVGLLSVRQVIEAGDKAIDAAGLNPWAMNEGLATGDERIDAGWIDAALSLAKGTQTQGETT